VKVIGGRGRCFFVFCLRETGLAQAVIAFEDLAALAADRLRAKGGEFVAPVRLVEGTARNPASAQSVQAPEKLAFAWDGADDQVGMRQVSGKKRLCNLDGCVAGLDDLLGNRKVVPDEEVNVWWLALREFHGWLLSRNPAQPILASRCGEVKGRNFR
jgi:hypothetical protein